MIRALLTRSLATLVIAAGFVPAASTAPFEPARTPSNQAAAPRSAPPEDRHSWRSLSVEAYAPASRKAIGEALAAARRCNGCVAGVGALALVLHAWEEMAAAAAAYDDARRLAPRDPQWWALSATLASRRGRHADAAKYFAEAARLAPSPLLTVREADARLEAGDTSGAEPLYRAAVRVAETEPAARYGLARVALARGDADAAWTELERAVALVPSFGAAHYSLALIARRRGDHERARREIELQQRCLACWPMPADPWAERVRAVRDDASALLQRGLAAAGAARDAEAIASHERALAADPSLVQAHVNLIVLYGRTGNLARAEEHYRAALASGVQQAEAHRNMGQALLAANDRARGAAMLALAVDANPSDAASLDALAVIAEGEGRLDQALSLHRRAVEADPVTRRFRFGLARTLAALRRHGEALAQLNRLTSPDDAESATYVFAAAAILVRTGEREKGRAMAEEALARARRHGLHDLAASISRDLESLK